MPGVSLYEETSKDVSFPSLYKGLCFDNVIRTGCMQKRIIQS